MRPRTFRPTLKHYLIASGEVTALGLLWSVMLFLSRINNTSNLIMNLCLGIFGVLLLFAAASTVYDLTRTWLTIEDTGLKGQIGWLKFSVAWTDIRIASYADHQLKLTTMNSSHTLPMRQLDGATIWQTIQPLIPRQALSPTAYQEHPAHQALIAFRQQVLADENQFMRLRYPVGWQVFMWTLGLTLTALVIYGLIEGVPLAFTLIFGFWAIMLLVGAFLSTTQVELTPKQITLQNPFRTQSMLWAEVDTIKARGQGGDWVLYKGKQRLHIPGSLLWFGQNRQRVTVLMDAQIWAQNMHTHRSNTIEMIYIRNKNVSKS